MNVISLFTGVGGFDLGLERAGHTIVSQCEADENARKVLRRHWPDVPLYEDVRTYKPVEKADLVCGGFPCQDLSVAGKRAGLAGQRSGLFFEATRIADAVLGDGGWLLIENVPGLFSSNNGRDFGVVLSTLAQFGFYDLAWRVLDSRYFGVPQRRRRVFILAKRSRGRCAAEVLLEPESSGGNHQAGRETREGTAATFGLGTAGTLGSLSGGFRTTDPDGQGAFVAPAVTSKWRKGTGGPSGDECQNLVSPSIHSEHSGRSPIHRRDREPHRGAGSASRDETNQLPAQRKDGPSSDTDGVRAVAGLPGRLDDPVIAFHATQEPIHSDDHFPALGAGAYLAHNGRGSEGTTCSFDPKPDGPRYAQMGNAVSVPVAEWIGQRLRRFG